MAVISATMVICAATAVLAEEIPFEGKQSASATLDQDGNAVTVTVDLSDGWSAQFAKGAVYLYDGPRTEGVEPVAIGMTLDEDVYSDFMDGAQEHENYRTEDGITGYVDEDGTQMYLFEVGENSNVYFLISVEGETEGNLAMSRIAVRTPEAESENSILYTQEDLDAAMDTILAQFEEWTGCELHSLSYAGDDESFSDETLSDVAAWGEGKDYTEIAKFIMDFHSPVDEADLEGTAWNPDFEYTDYTWTLAREEGGEWEVVGYGY